MFVRTLGLVLLSTGVFASLAPVAYADTDTASIMLVQQQLQANFLSNAQQLQYNNAAPSYGFNNYHDGQTQYGYDNTFDARHSWQDLRLRAAGSSRMTGTRLLTARTTQKSAPIRLRVNSTRVGGLGRQISDGSPSVSFHGITAGGGEGGAPTFGALHEGDSSFSFGGARPGSQ